MEEVNKAIEVLKMFCSAQMSCKECPFRESCGNTPEEWKTINADEVE